MKTITLVFSLLFSIHSFAVSFTGVDARQAIKAMSGCYEVTFHFYETGTTDPNYPTRSAEYNEHGLEWVALDRDETNLISLQHILITPQGPLKHWRQEWQFEPTQQLKFHGSNTWTTETVANGQGKWIQRTYQVDDSPRYECVAAFRTDTDGNASWECSTYAPLPRREFTKRSDYNVLDRTNDHVIVKDGWLHKQHNRKLVVKEANGVETAQQIATEEGLDTYKRVEDSRCQPAKEFWLGTTAQPGQQSIWHEIQDMWTHIRGHHPTLKFQTRVNGKFLWEELFGLASETVDEVKTSGTFDAQVLQKKAHDIIHTFFIDHE